MTTETDRKLLELAAKAAGIDILRSRLDDPMWRNMLLYNVKHSNGRTGWNPLTDDGDALRLAVALGITFTRVAVSGMDGFDVEFGQRKTLFEPMGSDVVGTARRAIVRAAAAIRTTPTEPKP